MKILYFAWLRERLNRSQEDVELPAEVTTVADLIDWLAARDEAAKLAFANRKLIHAAVDAKVASHDTSIVGASIVALFPPMTGG
jgi:molybdopterin synthase sulfur carrier subunit